MGLEWDDGLCIDSSKIDHDHKRHIALVGMISAATAAPHPNEESIELIAEFADSIGDHFFHEEFIMEKLCYPEQSIHTRAHGAFLQNLANLVARYEQDEPGILEKISVHVRHFFFNHLESHDRRLADYCQSIKLQQNAG